MIGLGTVFTNQECTKNILDLAGNEGCTTITDQSFHNTTCAYVILKGVDELLGRLDAINVSNQGITTNKDLSNLATMVNSRGVREDGVSGDGFMSSWEVKDRVPGLEVFL